VLASSASGAKVSFSAGTKNVFCDYPAGKAIYGDANNDVAVTGNITVGNGIVVNAATVSQNYTIASGYNGLSVGPVTVAPGKSVTVSSGQRWVVI
jgi:hypothetical protein